MTLFIKATNRENIVIYFLFQARRVTDSRNFIKILGGYLPPTGRADDTFKRVCPPIPLYNIDNQ